MEEKDVVKIIKEFISGQFPKKCNCCNKIFPDLAAYLTGTTHVGKPMSYDANRNDWQPAKPVGTIAISNCSCGSSLSVSSEGMNLIKLLRIMNWVRNQTKLHNISTSEVLMDIRDKIDKSVLKEAASLSTKSP